MNVQHVLAGAATLLLATACTSAPAAQQSGSVAGRVETPAGGGARCSNCLRPLAARVTFRRTGVTYSTAQRQQLTVNTPPSGKFRAYLPPGKYLVSAYLAGSSACAPAMPVWISAGHNIRIRVICRNYSG